MVGGKLAFPLVATPAFWDESPHDDESANLTSTFDPNRPQHHPTQAGSLREALDGNPACTGLIRTPTGVRIPCSPVRAGSGLRDGPILWFVGLRQRESADVDRTRRLRLLRTRSP